MDLRYEQFANTLVKYSLKVKPGERVLIQSYDNTPLQLMEAVAQAVIDAGGIFSFLWENQRLHAPQAATATPRQVTYHGVGRLAQMMATDCTIVFRGFDNQFEFSGVSADQIKTAGNGVEQDIRESRLKYTRWILTRMWTPAMAQTAGMSTKEFENFYLRTVLLNYAKMSKAMDPLVELMQRTDKVEITGPGTSLKFSIKGIPAIKCDGKLNIPDGEVFTAPVMDSVNGTITHNVASIVDGQEFNGICLTLKKGKIIKATCQVGKPERLNAILDTDKGARYVGEFSFGLNPTILLPMKDILFDEKIAGSFHFTPGNSYDDAPNGNKSKVHWDMVSVQRKEFGGGTIKFDGKIIRKDGMFVVKSLLGLNPDRLTA